jgi:predicted AAA+ superfamily ATPase
LLPLRFSEFVSLINPGLYMKLENDVEIFRLGEKQFNELASFQPHLKELSVLFDQFLITGGIMRAINEYFSRNEIGYETYELYQQWLRGDISRAGKSERTARQIIAELMKISVSAFGWETIAKKIDVASHKTVSDYIETMEDSFVCKTLYQIDLNTLAPRVKKLKKLHFLDSFILWSLRGWTDNWLAYGDMISKALIGSDLKARLSEMVVAGELFARFDRSDWLNSNIFFWKNSGEIDFIVRKERQLLPIEVKYQKKAEFIDFSLMKKLGLKKGILISMDRLDRKEGFVIIPLELFLLTRG